MPDLAASYGASGGGGGVTYRYCDTNGQGWQTGTKSTNEYTLVTADDTEWGTDSAENWYVVTGNVTINSRVSVRGDVHLILTDGCTLTVNGGIRVEGSDSLTIYAQSENESEMGRLTAATTSENARDAGIGGNYDWNRGGNGGSVTIHGGTVTANSEGGAGIGGSERGVCGEITIHGGNVTANGAGGAGIGGGYGGWFGAGMGGYRSGDGGAGGVITINGGTVIATGGNGAGIGGGNGGTPGAGGTITITGGAVTANGSAGGAGIGGGGGISAARGAGSPGGAGGTITITGGTVTATGSTVGEGVGAGIGGGAGSDGRAHYWGGTGGDGGEITITGGAVIAASGRYDYPDIGGGRGGYGYQGGQKPIAATKKIEIGPDAAVSGPDGRNVEYGGSHNRPSDDWDRDDTTHWHPCSVSDCKEQSHQTDPENHIWTGPEWTWHRGYAVWYAEATFSCEVCEWQERKTDDQLGEEITLPTCTEDGKIIYTATVEFNGTKYTDEREETDSSKPKTGHAWASEWQSSEDCHWHDCTKEKCPVVEASEKNGYGLHVYTDTINESDQIVRTCTVCSLTKTYTCTGISVTGPSKLAYTEGQALDLSGLEITVSIGNGGEAKEIVLGYDDSGVICTPAHGTKLTTADSGRNITVSYAGKEIAVGPLTVTHTPPAQYTVTVNGSYAAPSGAGSYEAGTTVSIDAGGRSNYRFNGWTSSDGIDFASAGSPSTTFTMPGHAVTVTANWTYTGGNSGGGGGSSYTPPTYPPTVERPSEGGDVTISPRNPEKGDKVTIQPKPDTGYEVDQITVTDRNGRPVNITENPGGTWSFTQPSGKVTIQVTYKHVETPWRNPFTDIDKGAWYYEAVRYAQERGLMNGYSDGRFGPNDNLSRAQLAQILHNNEGRPGVNYLMNFSDVSGEAWYTEAVRWATSQGIVGGYGDGKFGPNDPITREQLAVMLWRYAGSPAATNKELHFSDADKISGYALEAMRWAVENGIISGYGNGQIGPGGLATRAQGAAMLMWFFETGEEE